ncbi:perplasmic protein [Aquipluma nitroreducens]|uniref:Perplasmic protein n=1 Tax=Aquipluma nitroreducens TaxID=2010828 RepID=A0A5K7SGC8_9BACT|nr:SIMPL domain-containing protein [Aquipluma nitroreducens]BBE20536.1 perplasmic protein [Aquipluma nitroreducens]
MKTSSIWIISIALIVSFGISALFIGRSLQRFKAEDRSVSVKGFAEREVKADLAVWIIQTRMANNDLMEGSKAVDEAKNKVIAFMLQNQIKQEEIVVEGIVVTDKKAQQYDNFQQGNAFRYLITQNFQIRSNNVDLLQKVSRMTGELLQVGVFLSNSDYGNPLQFYFTKLNEIKPEMITEATQNARKAAQQFANENDSKLGSLKKANQGLFTIVDRTASLSGGEGGFASGTNDLYKKVRVVISAEYSIN